MSTSQWYVAEGGRTLGPVLHGRRPAVAPDRPLDRGHPGVSARRKLLDAGLRGPGAADRHRERRGAAASAGAAPDARGGLPDLRRRDAVRGGRARSRRGGRGRGGSHDVHELRHRDADDLRRREPDRFHGQDAGRRQAAAHRREPVHDRVREPGRRQTARGVRLALSGQDPAGATGRTGRPARRPEGRVPLRGQGRLDRHRVPAQDRDGAVRRRGLHHAVARGRRAGLPPRRRHGRGSASWPPARTCAWTPAVSSRSPPRSTTTSSSWAASSRPSSAARVLLREPHRPPDGSGSSRCRSAASPAGSTRRRRRPAAAARAKARCSAACRELAGTAVSARRRSA